MNISDDYCFNNYETLLKNKEIDIVYIALPTSFHKEWIIKCLDSEKKVLVEKPATMNEEEIEETIKYTSRLKTESGISHSGFGPSTSKALGKISERLIKISERVRSLGE